MTGSPIPFFGRYFKLMFFDEAGDSVDLSELRVTFTAHSVVDGLPQRSMLRVYNISNDLAAKINVKYTKVVLVAGYIQQASTIIVGRISFSSQNHIGADSYMDVAVNASLFLHRPVVRMHPAGATRQDVMQGVKKDLSEVGIRSEMADAPDAVKKKQYRRSKVLYGSVPEIAQRIAKEGGGYFTVQNNVAHVSTPSYDLANRPATRVAQDTGMVGIPSISTGVVKVQVLMNPNIVIPGRIKLDLESIINPSTLASDVSLSGGGGFPPPVLRQSGGIFRIIALEYVGDTRGNDWHMNITAALPYVRGGA